MPALAARALCLLALGAIASAQAQDASPPIQAPAGAVEPAPASAQAWLDRMNRALSGLDFRGTLVYLRDGQLDALGIEHRADAAGAVETLRSLSGEPLEVVRVGGSVRFSGANGVSLWPGTRGMLPSPPPRAASVDHYELVVTGQDRIAGRAAQVLEIRPRDGFRYGHRLWLDQSTALLLKALTYGPDGRPVEQLMFTELQVEGGAADAPASGAGAPAADLAPDLDFRVSAWRVLNAPSGFEPRLIDAGAATHLLFSDGVARVSVYVEPIAADRPTLSGLLSRGALHVFGRVAYGRQVIAIGDAPAATIERFAQGVMPVEAGDSDKP